MGVRCGPGQPNRARNAVVALASLNRQTLDRSQYQLIVIEQDIRSRCQEALAPLSDEYTFVFNPGPYNRGWAFNIGANLAMHSDIVCLFDSDLVAPANFLADCLERFAASAGTKAVKPYSTVEYLDEPTSNQLAAAVNCGAYDLERFHGPAWNAVGGCICVEGTLYREMGGYDERFRGWGSE